MLDMTESNVADLNNQNTNVYSNATGWMPYTASSSISYSNGTYNFSEYVEEVLSEMPVLLRINNFTIINKTNVEISFRLVTHKICNKFLPLNGTLYFGNNLYGVYTKKDYFYWENSIIVEFENSEEAVNKLEKDLLFSTVNNWDERITNEELFNFLIDIKKYKRFAHIRLEEKLEKTLPSTNLQSRLAQHFILDKELLNE